MATFENVCDHLAPPAGANGVAEGFFGFLTTADACKLRLVNRALCEDVKNSRWKDSETIISGSIKDWRACFPLATEANITNNIEIRNDDFVHLQGLEKLNMSKCTLLIDNAALAHLTGSIRHLNISCCFGITDDGLAYLAGIVSLNISLSYITDAGFAHLRGIRILDTSYNDISDNALSFLTGIEELYMSYCFRVTDAGIARKLFFATYVFHTRSNFQIPLFLNRPRRRPCFGHHRLP